MFEWCSLSKIHKVIDVNFRGLMDVCHEFVPLLYGRQVSLKGYKSGNGGRIINISSIFAELVAPNVSVYDPCKAAVSHFTHCLRTELSPRFGIWCCAMELGLFKSDIWPKVQQSLDQSVETAERLKVYDVDKTKAAAERQFAFFKKSPDLSLVTDDIEHALAAKYPRRTYRSGVAMDLQLLVNLVKSYHWAERLVWAKVIF